MARGRVALVTGSSRGLGAEIARRLARDGFAVAVNGRPGDEGVAAVARAIRDHCTAPETSILLRFTGVNLNKNHPC